MTLYRGPGGTGSATSDADTTLYQDFLNQTIAARDAALAAETAAELAETNAETAETNAETAEANAKTAATNAASSASAAAASEAAAAASFDSFDDRYLGAKAANPSVDNDGNVLIKGALYFNTSFNEMRVWDGTTWFAAYVSLSGALVAANNLSDLNNAATARTNLNVPTRTGGDASGTWGINITGNAATVTSVTSGQVTSALGYTPYNSTNPSGYITGINSSMVTTALGFTPYNATNPSGYVTTADARSALSFTAGSGAYNSTTGVITIPTNTNQLTNGAGYTTNTGTVTSVSGTGSVSGITLSGTVTSSGSLTLGGSLSVDALSTASGSAPSYSARAWINFDGTGIITFRAGGNVSSITDNGTGDYTVTFTTAMPDANYAVSGVAGSTSASNTFISGPFTAAPTSSAFRFRVITDGGAGADRAYVNLVFFS